MELRKFCLVLHLIIFEALASAGSGEASNIGVNYGRLGDNLPDPKVVANFVENSLIVDKIKIFNNDSDVLKAFSYTGVNVIMCIPASEMQGFSENAASARAWVHNNVLPWFPATYITYIVVGNEVFANDNLYWPYLLPAMKNVYSALQFYNLHDKIKVSTPHAMGIIASTYPPSNGYFQNSMRMSSIIPILEFLNETGASFMMNIYPYFPILEDGGVTIPLDYALLSKNATGIDDPNTGHHYSNLFDAMVDATISALANASFPNMPIIITETGWPSAGDSTEFPAGISNARTYMNNLMKHVMSGLGTPLRPNVLIDTYIYALFNENSKLGASSEHNFGLFYPNMTPVYDVNLIFTQELLQGRQQEVDSSGGWHVPSTMLTIACIFINIVYIVA